MQNGQHQFYGNDMQRPMAHALTHTMPSNLSPMHSAMPPINTTMPPLTSQPLSAAMGSYVSRNAPHLDESAIEQCIENTTNDPKKDDSKSGYVVCDMDEKSVKLYGEIVNYTNMMALKNDLSLIKNFNLVDDPELLDNLYLNQTMMHENLFLYNLLSLMYHKRYASLFEKYPSLDIWLTYCLITLIWSTERELKDRATKLSGNEFQMPKCGGINTVFTPIGRTKRNRSNGSQASEVPVCEKKAKLSEEDLRAVHPFLKMDEYIQFSTRYNIGKCIEYVLPADFMETVVTTQFGPTTHIGSERTKTTLNGVRIKLSTPIISVVTCRISGGTQKYLYMQLKFMEALTSIVERLTNLKEVNDCITFGSRQDTKCRDIMTDKPLANLSTETSDTTTDFMLPLLNNFTVFARKNGTFQAKAYSNIVSILDTSLLNVDEKKQRGYQDKLTVNLPSLENELDKYETYIESLKKDNAAPIESIESGEIEAVTKSNV